MWSIIDRGIHAWAIIEIVTLSNRVEGNAPIFVSLLVALSAISAQPVSNQINQPAEGKFRGLLGFSLKFDNY
ncbi:MAG: hypothetical protein DWI28_04890 [Planctomycetota bacterium]|nr:MAG: hypothetical protein DWI28_04890 [Planctomycetota bacterium]